MVVESPCVKSCYIENMFITPRNLSVKNKPYLYNMYRSVKEAFLVQNMVITLRNLSLKKNIFV